MSCASKLIGEVVFGLIEGKLCKIGQLKYRVSIDFLQMKKSGTLKGAVNDKDSNDVSRTCNLEHI